MKPVNLVPQDQRRRVASEGDGKSAPIVLGVLATLLVLVVVYVLTGNSVTDRKGEAATASAEADRLEARAGQQATYTDFAQIAVTRTQSVAGVAAKRFDWERFMRELGRVMPEGSWLQSADASVTGDPTSGGSSTPPADPSAAVEVAPAANLVGCTPDQDDVLLNESSLGEEEEEATVVNCGPLYTFNLTVKFTAIEPSKEAPRGTRGVPASLGGGS